MTMLVILLLPGGNSAAPANVVNFRAGVQVLTANSDLHRETVGIAGPVSVGGMDAGGAGRR